MGGGGGGDFSIVHFPSPLSSIPPLPDQLSDCQKQLQAYQEEKEALAKECHGLKVQLLDNDRTQARLTDTVSHLEARLAKADDERTATKAELEHLQESADRCVRTHTNTHTHRVASILHTYVPSKVRTYVHTYIVQH